MRYRPSGSKAGGAQPRRDRTTPERGPVDREWHGGAMREGNATKVGKRFGSLDYSPERERGSVREKGRAGRPKGRLGAGFKPATGWIRGFARRGRAAGQGRLLRTRPRTIPALTAIITRPPSVKASKLMGRSRDGGYSGGTGVPRQVY